MKPDRRLPARVDVLVIGGGVNGLAVAWEAARSGLSTLVVDKGDWGSGTSSWSSRMIHGGLKYLEKFDVRLVRESLRDREWLLQQAPHLVKPLPFLLPIYKGGQHSAFALRLGMLAYDVLSYDKSVPRHRVFSRQETLRRLPDIHSDGLQGSCLYYDAQVEFSERLCVELLLAAEAAGAIARNYVGVTGLDVREGRVVGAFVHDRLTGEDSTIGSTLTINVTGPWLDDIVAGTPEARRRWIGGTKGTHLVVDAFTGGPDTAMYYESDDGRPMMILPWLGMYMIGSTDKRFTGDLDTVSADDEEIDYILHETNKVFPKANLDRSSVHYWYTGVRPLPYVDAERTADISRRHEIHDHAPNLEGLLSVVGGKLTTFRALSGHAMEAVDRKLGRRSRPSPRASLPGYYTGEVDLPPGLPAGLAARLVRIYGARAAHVAALYVSDPVLQQVLDSDEGLVRAEVVFAVREEQAVRLSDVLVRRVVVGWQADLGRGCAQAVAEAMAPELGWNADDVERELADFEESLRRFTVVEPPS